jgi:putative membrane protein
MHGATTILADSWHGGHHAWWPILWLFWLILIGLLISLFARRGWGGNGRANAKAILAERYARGEISADEYRERLSNLKGRGSTKTS